MNIPIMASSRLMRTWSHTEDLKPGQPRLLETDNRIVVPVDATLSACR